MTAERLVALILAAQARLEDRMRNVMRSIDVGQQLLTRATTAGDRVESDRLGAELERLEARRGELAALGVKAGIPAARIGRLLRLDHRRVGRLAAQAELEHDELESVTAP